MERLRKIKKSALFIDILLLIAAIISIIGLSFFVRFHRGKAPAAAAPASTVTTSSRKLSALPTSAQTGEKPQSTPAGDTGGSSGAGSVQSAATDSPVALTCDKTKKDAAYHAYNLGVSQENKRFQDEVNTQYRLIGGLLNSLEAITQQLMPAHQQKLNLLSSTLQSQLSVINCNT